MSGGELGLRSITMLLVGLKMDLVEGLNCLRSGLKLNLCSFWSLGVETPFRFWAAENFVFDLATVGLPMFLGNWAGVLFVFSGPLLFGPRLCLMGHWSYSSPWV